jgi:hypothetical protein
MTRAVFSEKPRLRNPANALALASASRGDGTKPYAVPSAWLTRRPVETFPSIRSRPRCNAVVRAAQDHQIVRIITATLRAQIQMMDIQVAGIPTPRNHTPPPIAPEDFAPNRGRRLLCRAPTLQTSWSHTRRSTTHVGACEFAGIGCGAVRSIGADTVPVSDRDVLCVAVAHLDDCRIKLDHFAVRVLKAAPAVFTLRHDHLVTGAAGIAWTAQDFARHQQQHRVIVQPMVAPLLKVLRRFAKRRQRFRTDFEAQDVPDALRPAPIRGPVSRREPRNHSLHLARRLPANRKDPFALGLGHRDSTELPHHGPIQHSRTQSLRDLRQCLQRSRDSEFFLGRAPAETEQPLDVLPETRIRQPLRLTTNLLSTVARRQARRARTGRAANGEVVVASARTGIEALG